MARTTDPVVSETTPGPKMTKTEARQGQNVRGMITVLVASIAIVGVAFAAMLALGSQSDNSAATTPAASAPQQPAAPQ